MVIDGQEGSVFDGESGAGSGRSRATEGASELVHRLEQNYLSNHLLSEKYRVCL